MEASLRALLANAPRPDERARDAVAGRALRVLRPEGAFARLDEIAAWLAAWQRTPLPSVARPALIVFVADHGVTNEGVSAYPGSVTKDMLAALRDGVATASVLAREVGASVRVRDVGVGRPTGNIAIDDAMERDGFAAAFDAGRRAVTPADTDLLVLGEMGIGNTTAASALSTALFGRTPEDWTGRGTGVDDESFVRKVDVVRRAAARVGEVEPVEALRRLGGREMVAIAGAALEARLRGIPVVLDGFVVTASVAPLVLVRQDALANCIAGHRSPEPGHSLLLEKLALEPLLDLGLRLGEGTGALAAIPLLRMAIAAVRDVATFEERGPGA